MNALASFALFCLLPISLIYGEAAPKQRWIEELGSEEFAIRESAHAELSVWAMKSPQLAIPKFLRLSQEHHDPEVRKRALDILKVLANIDYLSDGQGYLGILMQEEPLDAAQGEKVRFGIRVLDVMNGSPAEQAGVKMGDLIVSLDGIIWEEASAMTKFSEAVAAKKPSVEVSLMVQRAPEGAIGITVKLGKRPVPDLGVGGDLGLLEQQAKDRHFEKWLKKQQKID